MDDLDLLISLHGDGERQGPGGAAETRRALELSGLLERRALQVADIGCGTGASTLLLSQLMDAQITAIDFLPAFLDRLRARAEAAGLGPRITTQVASMDALPFAPGSLDAIWSEGAIYNMGFERGVAAWRPFLKPGGILAVSELTWLTAERPAALESHWLGQYPEVAPASAKLAVLERHGYRPLGYFVLPESCWLEGYYRPLQKRFAGFLLEHGHGEAARRIVAAEEEEIALYERYRDFFSYGFYIAQKTRES